MSSDNIKVVVRARPYLESQPEFISWTIDDKSIYQKDSDGTVNGEIYSFDEIFDVDKKNSDIYGSAISPMVHDALNGINLTIFAYGATSSGKTYTMMGTQNDPGMIPRIVNEIFEQIDKGSRENEEFLLRVSYVEIYNEVIIDLLGKNKDLKIREDYYNCVSYNADEQVIRNTVECLEKMEVGNMNRTTGETKMNSHSSRSHSIFRITIESTKVNSDVLEPVQLSQINLIDLAGSERPSQTGATGQRFKEGAHINKSLTTLGLVIRQLTEKKEHISFRDSKLTRILSNSLGGNAKTVIICNINLFSIDDTTSTLMFAQRAKLIKNKPKINVIEKEKSWMKKYKDIKRQLDVEMEKNQELNREIDENSKKISDLKAMLKQNLIEKKTDVIKVPKRRYTLALGGLSTIPEQIEGHHLDEKMSIRLSSEKPKTPEKQTLSISWQNETPDKNLRKRLEDYKRELETVTNYKMDESRVYNERFAELSRECEELRNQSRASEKKLREYVAQNEKLQQKNVDQEFMLESLKKKFTKRENELLDQLEMFSRNKSNTPSKVTNNIETEELKFQLIKMQESNLELNRKIAQLKVDNEINQKNSMSDINEFNKEVEALKTELNRVQNELFEAQDKLLESYEDLDKMENKCKMLEQEQHNIYPNNFMEDLLKLKNILECSSDMNGIEDKTVSNNTNSICCSTFINESTMNLDDETLNFTNERLNEIEELKKEIASIRNEREHDLLTIKNLKKQLAENTTSEKLEKSFGLIEENALLKFEKENYLEQFNSTKIQLENQNNLVEKLKGKLGEFEMETDKSSNLIKVLKSEIDKLKVEFETERKQHGIEKEKIEQLEIDKKNLEDQLKIKEAELMNLKEKHSNDEETEKLSNRVKELSEEINKLRTEFEIEQKQHLTKNELVDVGKVQMEKLKTDYESLKEMLHMKELEWKDAKEKLIEKTQNFSEVIKNLNDQINNLKIDKENSRKQLESKENHMNKLVKIHEDKIKDFTKVLDDLNKQIDNSKIEKDHKEKLFKEKEAEFEKSKESQLKKIHIINENCDKLSIEKATLEQIMKTKETAWTEKEKALLSTLENLQTKLDQTSIEYNEKITHLTENIRKLELEKDSIENVVKNLRSHNEQQTKALEKHSKDALNVEEKNNMVASLEIELKSVHQKNNEYSQLIQELQRSNITLKSTLKKDRVEFEILQKRLVDLERTLEKEKIENATLQKSMEQLEIKRGTPKAEMEFQFQSFLNELSKIFNISATKNEHKMETVLYESNRFINENHKLNKKIKEIEMKLERCSDLEVEAFERNIRERSYESELKELRSKKDEYEKILENLRVENQNLVRKNRQYEAQYTTELKELRLKKDQYKMMVENLKIENQDLVRKNREYENQNESELTELRLKKDEYEVLLENFKIENQNLVRKNRAYEIQQKKEVLSPDSHSKKEDKWKMNRTKAHDSRRSIDLNTVCMENNDCGKCEILKHQIEKIQKDLMRMSEIKSDHEKLLAKYEGLKKLCRLRRDENEELKNENEKLRKNRLVNVH